MFLTFDTTEQSSYVGIFLDISGEYATDGAEETNKLTAEGKDRDDSVTWGNVQH